MITSANKNVKSDIRYKNIPRSPLLDAHCFLRFYSFSTANNWKQRETFFKMRNWHIWLCCKHLPDFTSIAIILNVSKQLEPTFIFSTLYLCLSCKYSTFIIFKCEPHVLLNHYAYRNEAYLTFAYSPFYLKAHSIYFPPLWKQHA